jgi:tRNA (guanine-N7-)-methyltransferase
MNTPDDAPPQLPENLVYSLPSIIEPLDLADLFPKSQPLEVELGSGDGSFLLTFAALHPERNFIGVERLMGRIKKLDKKGRRMGLHNLRGVRIESVYFLQYLLPPGSVDELHIYFPDPWPKKKHHKNRLINERFPTLARRVLAPNGLVHLRTDDADYYEQMLDVFAKAAGFEKGDTPEELLTIQTDFEQDFQAEGKATNSVSYQSSS